MIKGKIKAKNGRVRLEDREFLWEKDVKNDYLNTIRPSTARTVKSKLLRVDEYENLVKKSVYNLDFEEIDDMLESKFTNKSRASVGSNRAYIRKYVDFCLKNNLVQHGENRFTIITCKDMDSYVNIHAIEHKFIAKEERREIQEKIVNYDDRLYMELIPLGVRGRTQRGNTCEELINLKKSDIDFENRKMTVWNNDGEPREIYDLEDYTLDLIKKTIEQKFYKANNGYRDETSPYESNRKDVKTYPMNDTEYVFRGTRNSISQKVDNRFINGRFKKLKIWTEKSYLNITNLYFSGMVDCVLQAKVEKGAELDKLDYIKICEKFNYGEPDINSKGIEDWDFIIYKVRKMTEDYLNAKGM